MMLKKIVFILSLYLAMPSAIFAQTELDYEDDINPYFLGDSVDLVFPLLYDFFTNNSDHPAASLQLAILYEERYKSAHPISDYESAINNAERARFLYGNAQALIDEKEVRRNAWYYPNFTNEFKRNGKPVTEFESVKKVFEQGILEADSFKSNLPPIYNNFMKMVEQYDKATKAYVRINGDYTSLKDIYLLFDKSLEERFNLVKSSYDSTLYYFNLYKRATSNYPPFDINQTLSFKKINTYRLDGLVIQTDFLVDQIELWDYSSWVDQVKSVINSDISQLRKDIDKIETDLDKSFLKLQNWTPQDSVKLNPVQSKSIYKIRKYDLNSPVANVFEYKDDKLDLLQEQKSLAVYDTATNVSLQVKLYAINRVFQKTISLQNDLGKYNNEISLSNLKKNEDFYKKYYKGIDGFKQFFESEESWLLGIRKESAASLRNNIIDYFESPFLQDLPTYRNLNFEWQSPIFDYDSLPKDISFINFSAKNVNDLDYISGYFFDQDSISQAFYAAKSNDKMLWYNNIPSLEPGTKAWQEIGDIGVVGGGDLNLLLYERNVDSLDFINRLLVIDEKGKLKNEIIVDTPERPIKLTALRNSNLQIGIFQGDGFGEAIWPKTATFIKFNADSTDYDIKELDINGKFVGLFQTEEGIILASTSEDSKNIYVSLVDTDFNMLKRATFNFAEPVEIHYAYQVSNEALHLMNKRGAKGHIVMTDQLELRYSDVETVKEGI